MHLKLVCQPPLNTKEEEEEKYYSIRTGNTICTAHARNCFHFLSPPTFLRQSSDMDSFAFYVQVQEFLLKGEIPDNSANRRKVRRASTNFIIKDDRLFYVGPSRQYIRLVVLSEEEKRSVLTECHNNPGTGNHSGVRGTQNRVIAGYYWSTIIQDVKEWGFPQQCTGNSCGIYMLMYALSTCTSCPLTFTEEEVPLIRQWWCIQLMERFCLEGHGQRFAHWTEEASQLLQGTLEPVFRVSKSTTTKQSPSRRVGVEEDTDKVQQPSIVRDLHTAWYWVNNHRDLFHGEVTEPAFLQMNSESQQNALRKALGSEFPEAKDDFLFIFPSQDDMETFLSYCVDKQGLKVNAMFLNQQL
uniref:Uncharacterized LOC107693326 n=2 Tax=Sinocyclocheilus anshuiensis TaxID=1608454 RepID=A0A671PKN5_9TELE